jgi:hypothetical protein
MTRTDRDDDATRTDTPTLSRRDALAALAVAGVAGGGAYALSTATDDGSTDDPAPSSGPLDDSDLETMIAAAEVLYPSEIGGIEEFVTEFVRGRAADRSTHAEGIADTVAYLDEWTASWLDTPRFAALDPSDREAALDRMGVREAHPAPDGTDAERVRYYVVNELLFALYSSPTGGELVGIENPQGHPGGTDSYQRGPEP